MNNMQRIFCAVLTVWAGFLTYKVVDLEKKVNMINSMSSDVYRQVNDNSLLLDSIMEQVPEEVERISRKVAKEEGIKLFKQFADNFRKLSEEGKQ
tara:strand:+ start:496 stop:780 length:285 start_codon:yes stop_codon:yes gene_type:complete